jgi:2-phosphoglycolate phosphatase
MQAILFDLDGTLIDTAPDLAHSLNHIRAEEGLAPLPLNQIRKQVSDGAIALVKLGFGIEQSNSDYPRFRARILDHYEANIFDKTCLFQGIEKLLTWCEQQQLPWGIVTNKPRNLTEKLLEIMSLSERCQVLICPEDVLNKKPAPDPLLKAASILKSEPHKTLYVGDHLRDIQAAKAANMASVAAAYGYLKAPNEADQWHADLVIKHPEDLIIYLQQRMF